MLNLPPLTDHVREEVMIDLKNQLLLPIILKGDFNALDSLWKNKHKREDARTNIK